MSHALPWPGDGPGFINTHWHAATSTSNGKKFLQGKPTRTIDEFLSLVDWVKGLNNRAEIYMCMSQQAKTEIAKSGKPKAKRSTHDALAMCSLYADLDFKNYPSVNDAIDGLRMFLEASTMPLPSAIVESGGGLHIYWFSDRYLTRQEWQPYATGLKNLALQHGLKIDGQVTVDGARILRVPGTFNYKQEEPRLVKLRMATEADGTPKKFDFASALGFLPSVPILGAAASAVAAPFFDPEKFTHKGAPAGESLSQGIERQEFQLDIEPLYVGCGFIRNAIKTGGADYAQPLWNLSTLAATFLDQGQDLAHRMANKHPGYTRESTDQLWERKVKERADRGLGFPSCAAIQSAGCGDCATCPHLSVGKSPLNLALAPKAEAPAPKITRAVIPPQPTDLPDLPDPYVYNEYGYICIEKVANKVGYLAPLFHCRLTDPWAQEDPSCLNFTVSTDLGRTRQVSIEQARTFSQTELYKMLVGQGVKVSTKHKGEVEEFFVAWLAKLHAAAQSTPTAPLGWYIPDENTTTPAGFVFGGKIYKNDGTDQASGYGSNDLRAVYQPVGGEEAWLTAARVITGQKRADFQIQLATAFAGPCMQFAAQACVLFSTFGESGSGKSTALITALTAWAHPVLGKEMPSSTNKSVSRKSGKIRHLPVYWDEVRTEETQKYVAKFLESATEGGEGSRLKSNLEFQDRGTWRNMMSMCTNHSFIDYLVTQKKTTEAVIYRVFEIEAPKVLVGPGRFESSVDVSLIIGELDANYGTMGQRYAKYLATHAKEVSELTVKEVKWFEKATKHAAPERYWMAFAGTVMAGAAVAKANLGIDFDLEIMREYLVKAIRQMRVRLGEAQVEAGSLEHTQSALNSFLNSHIGQTLYTYVFCNDPHERSGHVGKVGLIHFPTPARDITVQYARDVRGVRIDRPTFTKWLQKEGIPVRPVVRGLELHMGAVTKKLTIGRDTAFAASPERAFCIDIPPGSFLEARLMAHSNGGEAPPIHSASPPE